MSSRILIVDDTPANIQALVGILKDKGYKTTVATNGKQAIDLLARVRPDLVLLDIMMPEMDGFEACRRIKGNPEWLDIPIIFLTARTEPEDIVRAFELGAVDYVSKPFNAQELLARVNTHLTLDRLNRENQRLLLNILPASIAEKLKRQAGIIAERYEDVSILFADIVDFTPLSAQLSPGDLVDFLNRIFSLFDELVDKHGLEKIKTVGDAYMVAGGLPDPCSGHLRAMARLALEMLEQVRTVRAGENHVRLRIGLNVGTVVAGVIGIRKFIYDVWGETVNTAQRLESHGVPDRINVSEAVYLRLKDAFQFEPRGPIDLKGQGSALTWFLDAAF